jgi:hypothetical protein
VCIATRNSCQTRCYCFLCCKFFFCDVSIKVNLYASHITYYELNSVIIRPVSKQKIEATTKRCIHFFCSFYKKVNRAHCALEIVNRKFFLFFTSSLHLDKKPNNINNYSRRHKNMHCHNTMRYVIVLFSSDESFQII